MVTVPCCTECNNSQSRWDESFRVYLSLHVTRNAPNWRSLIDQNVLPTLNHNQRLKREVLAGAEDVLLKSPAGLDLGPAVQLKWDGVVHDRVVERIVRGLHFHHTGEIVGDRADVRVQFLEGLDGVADAFAAFPILSLGAGQVLYKGIFSPLAPLRSAWVFEFMGWKWSSGYVEPLSNPV